MKRIFVRPAAQMMLMALLLSIAHLASAQVKGAITTDAGGGKITVSKEFVTQSDFCGIDLVRGDIDYVVYTKAKSNDRAWKEAQKKTRADDAAFDARSTDDIKLCYPGTYQVKVVVTSDCDDCVRIFDRKKCQ